MPRDNPTCSRGAFEKEEHRSHAVLRETIFALETRLAMHANTIKQLRERECPKCGYRGER